MLNISTAFKRRLYEDLRDYIVTATITLADTTVLNITNEHIMSNGLEFEDAVSDDESFNALGATVINSATLTLYNNDEVYSDYDFVNAKVVINVGLEVTTLVNNVETTIVESIKKGTFTVDDATYGNSTITLTMLDNMEQFDRPYSLSTLTYPATLQQIVNNACSVCDVTLATSSLTFPHNDYIVNEAPIDESTSFRDVIGYVATIAGCFARCDVDGKLELKWFDVNSFDDPATDWDGGTFNPWTEGNITDGGTFNPWTTGSTIDAGAFTTARVPHYISTLYSQDIGVDDVVITGVRLIVDNDDEESDEDTLTYTSGTDDYVIEISNNPFITPSTAQTVLGWLATTLIGLRFRKCNVSHANDPSIEAGDIGYVWDTKGDEHPILITRVNFAPNAPQTIVCGAQTPSRNQATLFSSQTKDFVKARKELRKQRDSYEAAIEDLEEEIANASGLYETQEIQPDQSVITYLHDKPLKSDSDLWIEISTAGVTVSPDAGDHWYGLTIDGRFLASVINTIALFFDYAHGGTLTLGGNNNTSGQLRILNGSGVEIGRIDNTGATISGDLISKKSVTDSSGTDSVESKFGIVPRPNLNNNALNWVNDFGQYTEIIWNHPGSLGPTYQVFKSGQFSTAETLNNWFQSPAYIDTLYIFSSQNEPSSAPYAHEMWSASGLIMEIRDSSQSKYAEFDFYYNYFKVRSLDGYEFSLGSDLKVNASVGSQTNTVQIGGDTTSSLYHDIVKLVSGECSVRADKSGIGLIGKSASLIGTSSNISYNGNVLAYNSSSSKRYKHDIQPLTDTDLDPHKLLSLQIKQFVYNKDSKLQYEDMREQTLPGFIAEEVAEIYPSAVIRNSEGEIESWDERRIIPGMLSLIQEQDKKIKSLEERLERLERLLLEVDK